MNSHAGKSKYVWGLATIGAAILILSIIVQIGPSAPQKIKTQILNRGLVGEPESLEPQDYSSVQAARVLRDVGEGLVAYSNDGQLVGGVAESWTVSDDGLEYKFRLRSNAQWSNGEPVTARDFVNAFRYLVTPVVAAANAFYIEQVYMAPEILRGEASSVELGIIAISDLELGIQLHTPTPYFLQLLTHPSTFPMYLPHDRKDPQARPISFKAISNGAYKVDDWIVGSEIQLSRNNEYWNNQNTFFDTVIYHIVQESAEFNRFRASELDITGNVPSAMFENARQEFGDVLHVAPYLGIYYYGFNNSGNKFSGKHKLRRALSLAIDREVLVSKVTGRGEKPAYSWVPPGVYGHSSQQMKESELSQEKREELARELYRDSGYGTGNQLRFELRYNTSDVQQRIALAIQGMWRETLGAEALLVNEEFKVLLSNIRKREITESFRLSWTGDYNDAHTFLQLFESDNPSNMTGYSNSVYDQLMYRAEHESNESKRRALLEQAEALVVADHVVIPLYYYVSKHLVHPRIVGWADNVLDIHPSQHLKSRSE